MNREIKFRAMRDDMADCTFYYGCLVYESDGTPRITVAPNSMDGISFRTCIKGTEGQFTGVRDGNGNDIYEGDILVNPKSEVGSVIFFEAGFALECKRSEDITFLIPLTAGFLKNKKVIGNIHLCNGKRVGIKP